MYAILIHFAYAFLAFLDMTSTMIKFLEFGNCSNYFAVWCLSFTIFFIAELHTPRLELLFRELNWTGLKCIYIWENVILIWRLYNILSPYNKYQILIVLIL